MSYKKSSGNKITLAEGRREEGEGQFVHGTPGREQVQ